jgi:FkbH-like protein
MTAAPPAVGQGPDTDERSAVRALVAAKRTGEAWAILRPLLRTGAEAWAWSAASNVLRSGAQEGWAPPSSRSIRLGILCTYTSPDLASHIEIACRAMDIDVEIYTAPYGQLEQEVLAPGSALAGFGPTHVVVAPTEADLGLPELADDPQGLLDEHEQRWRSLWAGLAELGARVVQHAFVLPDETPLGHLSARLPGSRRALVAALNDRLAAAGPDVLLVDCDRLAARLGKPRWADPRLWYTARQPYSYDGLRLLARETAAVLAGDLGLGARCLIVDLDNTLWGGIVAEEGPGGIAIGEGPEGEAHAAFQSYLKGLARRGVLLAVASKNDLAAAREPFEANPRMRLGLGDFAAFVADWRRKPEQIEEIAGTLGLPLGSFVFADDNPAECAEVAAALPEVDTIALTGSPSGFVGALAASPRFEAPALTAEDAGRQRSYQARAQAETLRGSTGSLEEFWASLDMRASVRPLDAGSDLDRPAQLTQKTNQFNLTLVRRSREELRRVLEASDALCMTLELGDRFADHGVIGLALALRDPEDPQTAVIDTLLLSCRVIGRTAEVHLLSHLSRAVLEAGMTRLRGVYVPGPRNGLVADLYPSLGFAEVAGGDGRSWVYDLAAGEPIVSPWIRDGA